MNFYTYRVLNGAFLHSNEGKSPAKKNIQTWRIMKLTFILITFACMNIYAAGYAQNVTYKGKNESLEKVFKSLRKQTGYVFFYSYDLLQQAKPVDINVKNVPLEEALKACFEAQPLAYTIEVTKQSPTHRQHIRKTL